jgi:hypothetical protein
MQNPSIIEILAGDASAGLESLGSGEVRRTCVVTRYETKASLVPSFSF